jgi:hypothetical protein
MQPLEILNELQLEWGREYAAVRQLMKTQCTSNVERGQKSKDYEIVQLHSFRTEFYRSSLMIS